MNYAHTYTCSRPARRSTFVAGRCEHVVLTTTRSIPYIYIYTSTQINRHRPIRSIDNVSLFVQFCPLACLRFAIAMPN